MGRRERGFLYTLFYILCSKLSRYGEVLGMASDLELHYMWICFVLGIYEFTLYQGEKQLNTINEWKCLWNVGNKSAERNFNLETKSSNFFHHTYYHSLFGKPHLHLIFLLCNSVKQIQFVYMLICLLLTHSLLGFILETRLGDRSSRIYYYFCTVM